MIITPDTSVFASFSASPGRFGATVYASLFEQQAIDAVYIPRAAPREARDIVDMVRVMNLAGASVSSPHKSGVIEHLDAIEDEAAKANAVNTIYWREGRLWGACSDIDGIVGCLADPLREAGLESALIFGAGGVVGPAVIALRRLGVRDITVTARRHESAVSVAERFAIRAVQPGDAARGGLLINATPAGVDTHEVPVLRGLSEQCLAFLDMPVRPTQTAIATHAEAHGARIITGVDMCVHQIASQAQRYLEMPVDIETVREIVVGRYLGAG